MLHFLLNGCLPFSLCFRLKGFCYNKYWPFHIDRPGNTYASAARPYRSANRTFSGKEPHSVFANKNILHLAFSAESILNAHKFHFHTKAPRNSQLGCFGELFLIDSYLFDLQICVTSCRRCTPEGMQERHRPLHFCRTPVRTAACLPASPRGLLLLFPSMPWASRRLRASSRGSLHRRG